MPEESALCHACGKEVGLKTGTNIGRSETCPECGADLRVCLNCGFYDPSRYNECREPVSERVVDKSSRTFCDYFRLRSGGGASGSSYETDKKDAMSALDDLFK